MKPQGVGTSVPSLEFNPEFSRALVLMEKTDRHVFVTGRAGTGKSTLLDYFRTQSAKPVVVLAPTGVAALNVKGQTIHSFFGFKPHITPAKIQRKRKKETGGIYRHLSTIVIDEVSMVRADLLDCVERFLRLNGPREGDPFGGVQMIFIGDLYQLPPVVKGQEREIFRSHYQSPYFFGAQAFKNLYMEFIELQKVYRQRDETFLRILNAVRNGTATDEDLAIVNRRVDPSFTPPLEECYIYLTSTNDLADRINAEGLARLKGRTWTGRGVVEGDFGREYLPTALDLRLKKGAQIMLLNNDAEGRWVNGTVGYVTDFKKYDGEEVIISRLESGAEVEIEPYRWEIFRFYLRDDELASEVVGSFRQYPVRLAFAVTIHKGQGKTFEKVIIDVGRGAFAPGQMYVALSRCTTLDGIVLKKPVGRHHLLLDRRVVKFLTHFQYQKAAEVCPLPERIRIIEEAIKAEKSLEIVYLKARDEKTRRKVRPLLVGDMEYNGHTFVGMAAICLLRGEKRVLNVEKILEINFIDG